MTISKALNATASIGVALWVPVALAADPPAARPGDDAMTCEQIYAEGAAESQREQDERSKKSEQLRNRTRATGALAVGATLTGVWAGRGKRRRKLPRPRPTARWPCSVPHRSPTRARSI